MFTILCPTDFSDIAANAVAYATEIAKQLKGRLHLTHLLYPTYVGMSDGGFVADIGLEALKDQTNMRLHKLAAELSGLGVTVTVSTEFGFWDSVLTDLEARVKPDLLVSGTKGAGSVFAAKVLGMHTLDMIKKIECPVLVVPPNFKFSKLDNIVYATDYQFEDIDHAEFAVKIAQINKATLHFVHITKDERKPEQDHAYMQWFKEMVDKQIPYEHKKYAIVVERDIEAAVEQYAYNENVDMICVSMRQRSPLRQLFSHSHTYRFVVDAVVPVLVFHLGEDFRL